MAERFGEKSNWAVLQHTMNVVIIPVGGWVVFTLWNLAQSMVQLQTKAINIDDKINTLVSQSQYDSDSKSIERRLDDLERDLKDIEKDIRAGAK